MKNPFNFEPEPLKGQANCGCQSRELEMDMEEFESEEELRGGRRFPARAGGLRSRPLSRPLGLPKRPLRPPLASPHRPWSRPPRPPYHRGWPVVGHPSVYREPYGFEPEPTADSEYVRWVQNCLNRILGLQLPVTGIIGTETRSALRSFQRQQGLRTSGIVGPDTEEALKAACGEQRAGEEDRELESIKWLPGVTAWLTWQPNNEAPKAFTWEEIRLGRSLTSTEDRGVYIVVLFERKQEDGKMKKIIKRVLKVGVARTQTFRERLSHDTHKKIRDKYQRGNEMVGYYLGKIRASDACPVAGCGELVEALIARTLIRSGKLRLEKDVFEEPYKAIKAEEMIRIEDILPKPLMRNLGKAYSPSRPVDIAGQRVGPVPLPGGLPAHLVLQKGTKWELEETQRHLQ